MHILMMTGGIDVLGEFFGGSGWAMGAGMGLGYGGMDGVG